ncbi:SAM-dependent methyltransferase [Gordoniibacillus kamchatkensis]|uniref:SAM-dependent methyltransferase n=1 Tax=Gordoniibacillus kamchatkensis TaxID=1590651 RepID=A0ABR5AHV1_9BACL|nr:SAM-dependent methyltransferase [Paenibacillus sp. VKM B-2647]
MADEHGTQSAAWYKQSFGADYLTIYKHRDCNHAKQEVRQMIDWLRLPPGARVLDLCCGMGRHSFTLAEFGYDVTGLDLSEVLLSEAKEQDSSSSVRWLQGDMRHVPLPCVRFDAVVNLFTSFGYFDDDKENRKVLLEIERLLQPGGKWIVDFLNPYAVVSGLVPHSERREGNMIIREARYVKNGMVYKQITVLEDGRDTRTYTEQVKLYKLPDFEQMLKGSSLVVKQLYGDYQGSSYNAATSPRMIMVGEKKAFRC